MRHEQHETMKNDRNAVGRDDENENGENQDYTEK